MHRRTGVRYSNLVAPLVDLSDVFLANALVEIKPDLASLIACCSFEILVRKLAERFGVANLGAGVQLHKVIEDLPNYGLVNALRKAEWKRLKEIRDALFHAGQMPSNKERSDLIEEIMKLEKDVAAEAR